MLAFLKKTKCILTVTILVIISLASKMNAGGSSSGSGDLDNCLCDMHTGVPNSDNIDMLTSGNSMEEIVEYVSQFVLGLGKKIQDQTPRQILVPEIEKKSGMTATKINDMVFMNFFMNKMKMATSSFSVIQLEDDFDRNSSYLNKSLGQFEKYQTLNFKASMKLPSIYDYKNMPQPNVYNEDFNFRMSMNFSIIINQFRRPSKTGYDIFFKLSPEFIGKIEKLLKEQKYENTRNELNFTLIDDIMFKSLSGTGVKFSMSRYHGNYVPVTICNNVLIFFSKVFKMMAGNELNRFLRTRSGGCIGNDGFSAEIEVERGILGSMIPNTVNLETQEDDIPFELEVEEIMVEKYLNRFKSVKEIVSEENIKPQEAHDIYYGKMNTYMYILLTVIKNSKQFIMYKKTYKNSRINMIKNFNNPKIVTFYKSEQTLTIFMMAMRVFMRYYYHRTAFEESTLKINPNVDFQPDNIPMWYLCLSEFAEYLLELETQPQDDGNTYNLYQFITTSYTETITLINHFLLGWGRDQGGNVLPRVSNFYARMERILRFNKAKQTDDIIESNNYPVVTFMILIKDFVFDENERGLLNQNNRTHLIDFYKQMELGVLPNLEISYVFSIYFLQAPIPEIFDEGNNLTFIDQAQITKDEEIELQMFQLTKKGNNVVVSEDNTEFYKPEYNPETVHFKSNLNVSRSDNNSFTIIDHNRKETVTFPEMADLENEENMQNLLDLEKYKKYEDSGQNLTLQQINHVKELKKENLNLVAMMNVPEVSRKGEVDFEIENDQLIKKNLAREKEMAKEAMKNYIIRLNLIITTINKMHETHNLTLKQQYDDQLDQYNIIVEKSKKMKKKVTTPKPEKPEYYGYFAIIDFEIFWSDLEKAESFKVSNPKNLLLNQLTGSEDAGRFGQIAFLLDTDLDKLENTFQNERALSEHDLIIDSEGLIQDLELKLKEKQDSIMTDLTVRKEEFENFLLESNAFDAAEVKRIQKEKEDAEAALLKEQERTRNIELQRKKNELIERQRILAEQEKLRLGSIVQNYFDESEKKNGNIVTKNKEYLLRANYLVKRAQLEVSDAKTNMLLSMIFNNRISDQSPGGWDDNYLFKFDDQIINDLKNLKKIHRSKSADYNRKIARLIVMSTFLFPSEENKNYIQKNLRVIFHKNEDTQGGSNFVKPNKSNFDMKTLEGSLLYNIVSMRYQMIDDLRTYLTNATTENDNGSLISIYDNFTILVDQDYHVMFVNMDLNSNFKDGITQQKHDLYTNLHILSRVEMIPYEILESPVTKFKIRHGGEDFEVERDLAGIFAQLCQYKSFYDEAKDLEIASKKKKAEEARIRMENEQIRLQREKEILEKKQREEQQRIILLQRQQQEKEERDRIALEKFNAEQIRIQQEFRNKTEIRKKTEAAKLETDKKLQSYQVTFEQNNAEISRLNTDKELIGKLLDNYDTRQHSVEVKLTKISVEKRVVEKQFKTVQNSRAVYGELGNKISTPSDFIDLYDDSNQLEEFLKRSKLQNPKGTYVEKTTMLKGPHGVSYKTTSGYTTGSINQVQRETTQYLQGKSTKSSFTQNSGITSSKTELLHQANKQFPNKINQADSGQIKRDIDILKVDDLLDDLRRRNRLV